LRYYIQKEQRKNEAPRSELWGTSPFPSKTYAIASVRPELDEGWRTGWGAALKLRKVEQAKANNTPPWGV